MIDSGSAVTTMAEWFYYSLINKPVLHSLQDLGLVVNVADGNQLPYSGYVEAEFHVPSIEISPITIPCLIVGNTEYNRSVPIIIGTNYIRFCMETISDTDQLPDEWSFTFNAMKRHVPALESPSLLTVCPRVVSVTSKSNTARIPVRICNISAKVMTIPPRSTLCELQPVDVLRSWTPDEDTTSPKSIDSSPDELKDLGIKMDSDCLDTSQQKEATSLLRRWTISSAQASPTSDVPTS